MSSPAGGVSCASAGKLTAAAPIKSICFNIGNLLISGERSKCCDPPPALFWTGQRINKTGDAKVAFRTRLEKRLAHARARPAVFWFDFPVTRRIRRSAERRVGKKCGSKCRIWRWQEKFRK